jgi:hypothetical protein
MLDGYKIRDQALPHFIPALQRMNKLYYCSANVPALRRVNKVSTALQSLQLCSE